MEYNFQYNLPNANADSINVNHRKISGTSTKLLFKLILNLMSFLFLLYFYFCLVGKYL